jgi:hypothetical protein
MLHHETPVNKRQIALTAGFRGYAKEETMADETNELLQAIANLWKNFNNCKAHFPYIPKEAKGVMEARTAPYYVRQGFDGEHFEKVGQFVYIESY